LESWSRRGDPREFIEPFSIQPGERVILLLRVSTTDQGKSGNLAGQRLHLVQEVEKRGGIVVQVVEEEWSGKGKTWLDKLTAVANLARQHNAIILAATADRLIRSTWFRSNHKVLSKAQAQRTDLLELEDALRGVKVMTYLHPDATPAECKSLLTRWGQEAKGKRGGRPVKVEPKPTGAVKRRRLDMLPRVLELHGDGLGYGAIAERLGLPRTTVERWVQSHTRRGGVPFSEDALSADE
jgi:DNA invertase Pin-like site-specific DNA recombinase